MDEKFYVYKGIYIYICICIPASKVYMNLAAAKLTRDTTVPDYTDLCVCALVPLRDALRDTEIFFRVFSTLHPLALRQVKSAACSICFSRLEFIFDGFYSVSFLIWCLDVVLHFRQGIRANVLHLQRGKNVVAYLQLLLKEIFYVHISVLCLLQLCTVKCSLFKMMKFS